MTVRHSKLSAAQLDAAYRATTYRARLPTNTLALRIGQPCEALERLLVQSDCRTWAFISAGNPGSNRLGERENLSRHLALVAAVNQLGLIHFEGAGCPPTPDWTPERSLLILGITRPGAHALASRFGQSAIVFGTRGHAPELQYVHSPREAI